MGELMRVVDRICQRPSVAAAPHVVTAVLCVGASAPWVEAAESVPRFELESGLAHHQVLQRDDSDSADVSLAGSVSFDRASSVEARIVRRQIVLNGFAWRKVGQVVAGRWQADLRKIPMGGPYDFQLRAVDDSQNVLAAIEVHGVLVGDLWVLSGQSNMVGNGRLVELEPPHELVHNFNMRYEWEVAEEPLHSLAESTDEAHWANAGHLEPLWAVPRRKATGPLEGEERARFRRNRQHGTGLALSFAKQVVSQTGVPIGLIPCAHGGTSLKQWDPGLKSAGRKSLYGAQLARIQSVGGTVKGVLWYQGEADMARGSAAAYGERFRRHIEQLRADLQQPDLPFYFVQIGRYVTENPMAWNVVQEAQRIVEQTTPHVGMVVSVDQPLDDIIHISGGGLKTIGRRLASRVLHDHFPQVKTYRNLQSGPRPVRAYYQEHPGELDPWSGDRRTVFVEFSGVNGRLTSLGRATGFSLRDKDGKEVLAIFRTLVDPENPSRAMLELGRGIPNRPLPAGTQLWYGWGSDPYCNLTDEANLAVPVFGPMEIDGVNVAESVGDRTTDGRDR